MQYVIAFVTGGMICALSQILMEKQTKMLQGHHGSFGLPWGNPWICGRIYEPFSNGLRRGARCLI